LVYRIQFRKIRTQQIEPMSMLSSIILTEFLLLHMKACGLATSENWSSR